VTTETTIPPAGSAGPAGPRPDAGLRLSLRILAVGFALLTVGWTAFTVASLLARVTDHRSATYDGVRALDIDLGFESVEIVGAADATSVSMTRSYTWSLGKPSITNRLDGDLLSISSSCPLYRSAPLIRPTERTACAPNDCAGCASGRGAGCTVNASGQ